MDKEATLTRKYQQFSTTGELAFGDRSIFVFERADLDNKPMVSCIPEGRYLCKWSHMVEHNVDHYQLQDVPGRTAIFIHIASMPEQLHGCIGSDRASIGSLEAWGNKEDFWLTIKAA